MNVHEFQFPSANGRPFFLERYRGQPLLLVNTASGSPAAPQLRKLQRLWENYRDCGLLVLGIPSNDFSGGEPLQNQELRAGYLEQFGVRFPLTAVTRLVGISADPLFVALAEAHRQDVMPNGDFCKYLFDAHGRLAGYWPGAVEPDDPALLYCVQRVVNAWII